MDATHRRSALAILLATPLWLGACATRPQGEMAGGDNDRRKADGSEIERGIASWYGDRHHGRRTASGEVFDMNALTAAHKTLPFGTRVRVRHLATGLEVTVRINDRGPFTGGRIIDLSRAAAERIGLIRAGVSPVVLLRD